MAVPSQTLVRQSLRKQYSAARLYPQPHPILCRKTTANTRRNTETIINLLFSSGTVAATLTNYEIKIVKYKIKSKKGMETTKTIPKNKIKNIKKGQLIKKQLKSKKKIDQKIQKNTKNKNRFTLLLGGPIFSLFFSCYALAALQPIAINHQSRHPPQDRHPPPEAPSPPPDLRLIFYQ